uniref:Uncharacterized protein n=1 Tax=Rhodnius prolixus TaxID=13249 RepID=T1HTD3_RHOPR
MHNLHFILLSTQRSNFMVTSKRILSRSLSTRRMC